jgi:hypothetical protein
VDSIVLATGSNSIQFTSLLTGTSYEVRIVTDYDLNDGAGTIAGYQMVTGSAETITQAAPSATIDAITAGDTTIDVDVTVTDADATINGNLKAVLYKDGVEVDSIVLATGSNSIQFTSLLTGTSYEVRIVTDYDLNDGVGTIAAYQMVTGSAETITQVAPSVTIGDVVQDETSIDVVVTVTDNDATITGNLKAVLYKDGVTTGQEQALVPGVNDVSFTGLFTGTEYEVRVFADYDLNDGITTELAALLASDSATTLARQVPTITITSQTITEDEVVFTYVLDDTDNVMTPGTVQAHLVIGGVIFASQPVTTNTVSFDLSYFLADFAFEIRLTADYDLGDEAGAQNDGVIETLEFRTLAFELPTVEITESTVTELTLDLEIEITDEDSRIFGNLEAILYDNAGNVMEVIPLIVGSNSISFNQVIYEETMYRLEIQADYNMGDGAGNLTDRILYEQVVYAHDKPNYVPSATIDAIVAGDSTIDVDITFYDQSFITTNRFAVLYKDGSPVGYTIPLTIGLNTIQFNGLLTGSSYEVRIITDYDMEDGNGIISEAILDSDTAATITQLPPSAVINSLTPGDTTIDVDVTVTDTDSVITGNLLAVLYKDGVATGDTIVLSVGANNVQFTGLLTGTTYEVKIVTDYDLRDGAGEVSSFEMDSDTTATITQLPPSAVINSLTPDDTTIDVDVTVIDSDNVITSNLLAVLYKDGVATGDTIVLSVGANNVQFTGLLTDTTYEVKIVTDYDLGDGTGEVIADVLVSQSITTDQLVVIDNILNDLDGSNKARHQIDITFTDTDSILTSNLIIVTLHQNGTTIATYIISSDVTTTIQMIKLYTGYDYRLEMTATYDIGFGNVTDVIYEYTFTTEDLDVPSAVINSLTPGDTTIDVDVTVTDTDSVITGNLLAVLYKDGVATGDTIVLSVGANNVQFTGLLTGTEYEVRIETDYDLLDGNGTIASAQLATDTTSTITQLVPTVAIEAFEDWTLTPNISFDLTVGLDDDNVATDTGWVAYLYVDGVLQETLDIDATYGNPENTTTTITFSGYAASGTEAYTIVITALIDLGDVEGGTATETAVDSATGIDAGN